MKSVEAREDRLGLAVILMLIAFLCFVCMDSIAKWLVTRDLPPVQVAFVRYAGHLVFSMVIFLPRHGVRAMRSNTPWIQGARGFLLLFSTVSNFTAVYYLPLPITISIMFAAPLVVCLLSIPILGEQVGMRRIAAVLVGFAGVLIIVNPGGTEFHWSMFLSVGALFGASTYFVLSRLVAGVDDNSTSQIWSSGIATFVLLPLGLVLWQWPASSLDGFLMILIGILATIGHSFLTIAHRFAAASVLAPLVYVQIIYVSFVSWIVFGQPPTLNTLLGTSVIVASGFYIWNRERRIQDSPEN